MTLPKPDSRYTVTVTISRNPGTNGDASNIMTELTYPNLNYCALVDVEGAIVGGLVHLGHEAQEAMGCNDS